MRTTLRSYYRGHNLVMMRDHAAGQNRYYHFDLQGTAQCLTDSTGTVSDRFAANAWGVPVKRTGTSINRHWYIGNLGYEQSTRGEPLYVRNRYFTPARGAWNSVDQLRPQPRFGYGWNSPLQWVDPSGLDCKSVKPASVPIERVYRLVAGLEAIEAAGIPKCNLIKLGAILTLMCDIADSLRMLGLEGAANSFEYWVAGTGKDRRVSYRNQFTDDNFHSWHRRVRDAALRAACDGSGAGPFGNDEFTFGELPSPDLHLQFHAIEKNALQATVETNQVVGKCQNACSRRRVTIHFTFRDFFNWENSESTGLPPIPVGNPPKFRQRWANELRACCVRDPAVVTKIIGGPCPKDFSHVAEDHLSYEICCRNSEAGFYFDPPINEFANP